MFLKSTIQSETDLKSLVNLAKNNLDTKRVIFKYPQSLTNLDGLKEWASKYSEIDLLNNSTLLAINGKAGVYAIYIGQPDNEPALKYVGQTNQKGAKQRIRSHLVWRNKETKSKKYTGSKFDEVVDSVTTGQQIYLSFCEISPASLRHYVEENLFAHVTDGWNKHGV